MLRSLGLILLGLMAVATPARAEVVRIETGYTFDQLYDRVVDAVGASPLNMVYRASASRMAAQRGVDLPGNAVFGVFNNDFAVRLNSANVAAGIRAPLVLYLTEGENGTGVLSYERPMDVLAPFGDPTVNRIAVELERLIAAIAATATASQPAAPDTADVETENEPIEGVEDDSADEAAEEDDVDAIATQDGSGDAQSPDAAPAASARD